MNWCLVTFRTTAVGCDACGTSCGSWSLRNTNNVLNGNTKVGINKHFRTFKNLACYVDKNWQTWVHAMNALSVSFGMNEMFDPSSDFRSVVSPSGEWCWHQAPVPWPDEGDGVPRKNRTPFCWNVSSESSSSVCSNQHKKPKTIG